ncbi:hypothetical protein SELMODRAFT_431729 [Selaginella moellendorffii]|uniref:Uncharacterized protein n=1 Tax=Selaginella moellendorffii TaxID=88036 RepID=D8TDL1_SELML|nr:hypothetical protein SELMODRAFT_431729 [Selaginella moellendorffii]
MVGPLCRETIVKLNQYYISDEIDLNEILSKMQILALVNLPMLVKENKRFGITEARELVEFYGVHLEVDGVLVKGIVNPLAFMEKLPKHEKEINLMAGWCLKSQSCLWESTMVLWRQTSQIHIWWHLRPKKDHDVYMEHLKKRTKKQQQQHKPSRLGGGKKDIVLSLMEDMEDGHVSQHIGGEEVHMDSSKEDEDLKEFIKDFKVDEGDHSDLLLGFHGVEESGDPQHAQDPIPNLDNLAMELEEQIELVDEEECDFALELEEEIEQKTAAVREQAMLVWRDEMETLGEENANLTRNRQTIQRYEKNHFTIWNEGRPRYESEFQVHKLNLETRTSKITAFQESLSKHGSSCHAKSMLPDMKRSEEEQLIEEAGRWEGSLMLDLKSESYFSCPSKRSLAHSCVSSWGEMVTYLSLIAATSPPSLRRSPRRNSSRRTANVTVTQSGHCE